MNNFLHNNYVQIIERSVIVYFFIIIAILFVFRPRKWPEYFSVGLLDVPFGEADGNIEMEERRIAPLL